MARYIDADELEKAIDDAQTSLQTNNDKMWEINKPYFKGLAWARALVIEQPTADVVEVKHGEWISRRESNGVRTHQCSVCGRPIYTIDEDLKDYAPYCHCGAKMDGRKDD